MFSYRKLILVAAAFAVCVPMVSAQDAPNAKIKPSPNAINKGSLPGTPSGAQSGGAANGTPQRVAGHGKYCSETSAGGPLNCVYASLSACKSHSKADNLRCVVNPRTGTTGAR